MSVLDPNDLTPGDGAQPAGAPGEEAASLDPAQQSLAEALRITFRLLQVVMLLLVVLFLGSGFQTVKESEQGIKLAFGRVRQTDVLPGYVWNWPYPLGELIKVPTGQQTVALRDAFFPQLTEREERLPREQLASSKLSLRPGVDGSLLTADGNIVHTRWDVTYLRVRPAEYVQNVYQQDETAIVKAAVERGVVRVVEDTDIDSLLKQAPGGAPGAAVSSLSSRIRRVAQETLDSIHSGLRIEEVILTERTPPFAVLKEFDQVAKAAAEAGTKREKANQLRRTRLNATAGAAHDALLARLDEYERALELKEEARAEEILAGIDGVFDGEPVEWEGREVRVSGDVTSVLNDARRYRADVVASSRGLAAAFAAKRESFHKNPRVFVANERRAAFERFVERNTPEILLLPPGGLLEVILNRDPEIAREQERERNRQQGGQTIDERIEQLREEQRKAREESSPPGS